MQRGKVIAMWEEERNGVHYFKDEDDNIYFPNPNDPRPSRQFYAGKGERETSQISLRDWVQ